MYLLINYIKKGYTGSTKQPMLLFLVGKLLHSYGSVIKWVVHSMSTGNQLDPVVSSSHSYHV